MRTNGLASPAAEALAQTEDDHQRWADDGGSRPEGGPTEFPAEDPLTEDRSGLPIRRVYRRPAG